jgi:hypothetical protein
MKIRLVVILTISLLATPIWAQNEFQSTTQTPSQQLQKNTEEHSKAGQPLPPKASGVVIMMSERGLQVINPLAPKELGTGKKVVTQSYVVNPTPGSYEDPKPFGGINIIGFDF